jgi:hypothetical protein
MNLADALELLQPEVETHQALLDKGKSGETRRRKAMGLTPTFRGKAATLPKVRPASVTATCQHPAFFKEAAAQDVPKRAETSPGGVGSFPVW